MLNISNVKILISFIFFITIFSSISQAEIKTSSLTFQQCLDLAQKKSSDIKIQEQKMAQASERLNQADGDKLPNIKYSYIKTFRDTAGGAFSGDFDDAKLTLNQPLFYGFRKEESAGFAKSEIEKERLQFKIIYLDLKNNVIQAFYSLVKIDKDIMNIETIIKLLETRYKEINARVRLGKSRESELLMIESQVATLRAQEEKAYGDRAKAVEFLSFLTGIEASSLTIIDDSAQIENIEPVEKFINTVSSRPDIEAARQDILSQVYKVRIAKGAKLPVLDFDGSWYHLRSGSLSSSKWDAILSLDIPLFQGGVLNAKLNEENARLKEYEERLNDINQKAQTQVRTLYQSAASSIKQAAAYKNAYEKAEKSYQIQLRDYKFGLVNNLDVLQSMSTMLDVKRNFDKAVVQVKIDKGLLEAASGK